MQARVSFALLVVNQDRTGRTVRDLGSLIEIEKLAQKTSVMTGRDYEVGIQLGCNQCNLLGWIPHTELCTATRVGLANPFG